MNKLKLFLLGILGLALIPTTNAYDLGFSTSYLWFPNNGFDSSRYGTLYYQMDNNYIRAMTKQPVGDSYEFRGPLYYSSYGDTFLGPFLNESMNLFGVGYRDEGESRVFYYSALNGNNEIVSKTFISPSRTAFLVTMKNGTKYMMDKVYFVYNGIIFMDSTTGYTLFLLGNLKTNGGVFFVDPFLSEDNFYFVRFQEKKAWSTTLSKQEAWKWFFGSKNGEDLQHINFNKSYNVQEGGSSLFPMSFNYNKDNQGGPGYLYLEDIEYDELKWNVDSSNNQNGSVAENYNKCVSYYSDIKNLAYYSKSCGDDEIDEETFNWVKVDSWNGEGEVQTILDQLTGANKFKCGRFANLKKKYHDKYKDTWDSFYQEFGNYARFPESIDISVLCRGVELEHGSAGDNVDATKDTPFTNFVKNIPLVGLVSDYLYNPIANFISDGIISLFGGENEVVCAFNGNSISAKDVLLDKSILDNYSSDCRKALSGACDTLNSFKDVLFEKYKSCEDSTHYVRNHLGDVRNKNFSDLSFVDKVVGIVRNEFDKGSQVFPSYYCSRDGISREWDYLVRFIFLIFCFILVKLL